MKLGEIFIINQGHQITDEEIYQNIINGGKIPIITANNEVKGFWNKSIIKKDDLPCITYPTKANSGVCFVQYKIFDANNTAVLIPKDRWKDKIYLGWLTHKLTNIFLKIATNKEGVNYLNRKIVEDLELDIPLKNNQEKEYELVSELIKIKQKIDFILYKIEKIKSSILSIDYKKYQKMQVSANEIFHCLNGNTNLTEEYIYSRINVNSSRKYEVLSSSTIERTSMGNIPKGTLPNNKNMKVFEDKEGLLVVRNGRAGSLYFLNKGSYTLNDHAYILYLKNEYVGKIDLKWIIYQYQKLFLEYSSSSDNGTWNKSGFFKYAKIDIPDISEQHNIVEKFKILETYEKQIKIIQNEIELILSKEVM